MDPRLRAIIEALMAKLNAQPPPKGVSSGQAAFPQINGALPPYRPLPPIIPSTIVGSRG